MGGPENRINMFFYQFLDYFFLIFHTLIIIFNLFGWLWKPTRKWNLLLLLLTGMSWFVLGLRYGIGYCPCTDWHWQVKLKLGEYDLPNSYIQYLVKTLSGLSISAEVADALAGGGFFLALIFSIWTNYRDWKRSRST